MSIVISGVCVYMKIHTHQSIYLFLYVIMHRDHTHSQLSVSLGAIKIVNHSLLSFSVALENVCYYTVELCFLLHSLVVTYF